ncbi:MAG: queuosine precursor transporter [Synergistaceae bacterium]|nr:queuosine precursor transporter [Synergistaceae bacterium]
MRKTNSNLVLINGVFITSLLIANVVSSKIVYFWDLTVPAAIVAYPLTFLMTDVIGEIWGKDEANKTVKLGFWCQCISLFLIMLAMLLPVAPFADNQAEFTSILGSSFRVVFASMIAYLCSQTWDVWIFHKIRDFYIMHFGSTRGGRWIWNNASTMTSQMIDTAIFITGAFYGIVPSIWSMILSQYLVKVIYAALDTIPFYLLTNSGDDRK